MITINGNIENFLKLPIKIMVALCISSGLILFLPDKTIEKIYMLSFRNEFGFILGLVFIVSLSIILCTIIVNISKLIINKIRDIRILKARNKIMENLDINEKNLLKRMYEQNDKTLYIHYDNGMTVKLSNWGLISPVMSENYIDPYDPKIPYFLQPWVCKYIDEHKDF